MFRQLLLLVIRMFPGNLKGPEKLTAYEFRKLIKLFYSPSVTVISCLLPVKICGVAELIGECCCLLWPVSAVHGAI